MSTEIKTVGVLRYRKTVFSELLSLRPNSNRISEIELFAKIAYDFQSLVERWNVLVQI